jgi:hypothetical protein
MSYDDRFYTAKGYTDTISQHLLGSLSLVTFKYYRSSCFFCLYDGVVLEEEQQASNHTNDEEALQDAQLQSILYQKSFLQLISDRTISS